MRRLSRLDLIDIIYELQKQNQQKDAESRRLRRALKQKKLIISNAGSIAEAAMQINRVMEAAQAAADQYVLSVKAVSNEAERMISGTGEDYDHDMQVDQDEGR